MLRYSGSAMTISIDPHRERIQAKLDRQKEKVERSPAMRMAREADNQRYIKRGIRCEKIAPNWKEKIAQAIKVELSSRVLSAVFKMRMGKCGDCIHCTIRRDSGLHFCECCGCGQWTFKLPLPGLHNIGADMESKNQHSENECPLPEPKFKAVS